MMRSSIPVDLRNPGQVFACLGLMEAAEILCGPCEGRFAYSDSETDTRFEMTAPGEDPVSHVISFLASAEVVAISPRGSALTATGWNVKTEVSTSDIFAAPAPNTPATLPVRLRKDGIEIPVDHWLDGKHSDRDNIKFWAGAGGYPGAALARDAIQVLQPLDAEAPSDPFQISAQMDSSFRFDWRRDYVPLDSGFSPNKQPAIGMVGYPLVELLAAIGLQHARPARVDRRNKLAYRYHVSNRLLSVQLVRAVLGAEQSIIPKRTFIMKLGWPGQEGQARCIIDAEEELP